MVAQMTEVPVFECEGCGCAHEFAMKNGVRKLPKQCKDGSYMPPPGWKRVKAGLMCRECLGTKYRVASIFVCCRPVLPADASPETVKRTFDEFYGAVRHHFRSAGMACEHLAQLLFLADPAPSQLELLKFAPRPKKSQRNRDQLVSEFAAIEKENTVVKLPEFPKELLAHVVDQFVSVANTQYQALTRTEIQDIASLVSKAFMQHRFSQVLKVAKAGKGSSPNRLAFKSNQTVPLRLDSAIRHLHQRPDGLFEFDLTFGGRTWAVMTTAMRKNYRLRKTLALMEGNQLETLGTIKLQPHRKRGFELAIPIRWAVQSRAGDENTLIVKTLPSALYAQCVEGRDMSLRKPETAMKLLKLLAQRKAQSRRLKADVSKDFRVRGGEWKKLAGVCKRQSASINAAINNEMGRVCNEVIKNAVRNRCRVVIWDQTKTNGWGEVAFGELTKRLHRSGQRFGVQVMDYAQAMNDRREHAEALAALQTTRAAIEQNEQRRIGDKPAEESDDD